MLLTRPAQTDMPPTQSTPLTGFGLRPLSFVVAMWGWKEPSFAPFMSDDGTHQYDILYFDETITLDHVATAIERQRPDEMVFWGMMEPEGLSELAARQSIPVRRVEDGFLRSAGLTASRTTPLSLCFDTRGIYFNPQQPSDLEHYLMTHDFDGDTELMARARAGITRMLTLNVSKYNHTANQDVSALYGPKTKERILVLGQVETDQSIQYGCPQPFENNDLVRLAARENPDAQIIYKPHPDVLAGDRERISNPDDVRDIALIIDEPLTIGDAFDSIDRVYTATSLGGFEALIRNIPVTTIGQPFYAGWGLTDDRQPAPRMRRDLTIEQIFAAAYILYPTYRHPVTGLPISFEAAIDYLADARDAETL